MISSRRISKLFNKFSLFTFGNATSKRNLSSKIIKRIDITESYSCSTSIGKTVLSNRNFSTSRYLLAKTETMKGEGDRAALNLEYEDIVEAQKDESVLIVDVREDAEIKETGKLPGSIHVPMGDVKDVFKNLSEQAFVDKYQKPKPSKDTKIIFSCRSGRRSATVQDEMIKLGYEKSYNYTGGWLDWESKQK